MNCVMHFMEKICLEHEFEVNDCMEDGMSLYETYFKFQVLNETLNVTGELGGVLKNYICTNLKMYDLLPITSVNVYRTLTYNGFDILIFV